jgi:mRNA interferase RelE/StbE
VAYGIAFSGPARRAVARLPEKVATAAVEFLYGSLAENPRRVGKPLVGDLRGTWSARRGDYRVLYVIDDETEVVTVLTVAHRADAYRRAE